MSDSDSEVQFKKTLKGIEYIIYNCPVCGSSLNSPVDEIGMRETCPECDQKFIVPGQEQLEARRSAAKRKRDEAEVAALLRKEQAEFRDRDSRVGEKSPLSQTETESYPASNLSEEEDLYLSKRAMFASNPVGFVLSLLMVPFFGIGLLILIVWYLQCLGSSLRVTNKRSILRSGLFSKHTSDVLHRDVRNIQVSQGIMNRMLGVGSIGISSSGQSDFEIFIKGVEDPYKAKAIIDQVRLNS